MTSLLGDLPEDVIVNVLRQLGTARDVAHLSALNRQWNNFIKRDGWRIFVRSCFSSLNIPPGEPASWKTLADHLTLNDRCWDQRAFQVTIINEPYYGRNNNQRRHHPPAGPRQRTPFPGIVDAHLTPCRTGQVVVIGAGENITGLFRPHWRRGSLDGGVRDVWKHVSGRTQGYASGMGDVTALATLELDSKLRLVAGRADGDLRLLSAEQDSFGDGLAQLSQTEIDETPAASSGLVVTSPHGVVCLDWQPRIKTLLTATRKNIFLHTLDETSEGMIAPLAAHNLRLSDGSTSPPVSFVRSAKFINSTTIACGVARSLEPLRWLRMTESGFSPLQPARGLASDSPEDGKPTTVRAVAPVGALGAATGNDHLVLSAWDDGTIRLWDVRGPSGADVVYRDDFQSLHANALLVYGAERFVAGTHAHLQLKIFDFRWPKPYHHTDAMPCGLHTPHPAPPYAPVPPGPEPELWPSTCSPTTHRRCRWHALAASDQYRPNCTINGKMPPEIRNSSPIYSLAKASDLTDSFYVGVGGGVMEFNLAAFESRSNAQRDLSAHALFQTRRRIVQDAGPWDLVRETVSVLETGPGIGTADFPSIVPKLRTQTHRGPVELLLPAGKRLDDGLYSHSEGKWKEELRPYDK